MALNFETSCDILYDIITHVIYSELHSVNSNFLFGIDATDSIIAFKSMLDTVLMINFDILHDKFKNYNCENLENEENSFLFSIDSCNVLKLLELLQKHNWIILDFDINILTCTFIDNEIQTVVSFNNTNRVEVIR